MLAGVKRGDRVVTGGGIIGLVTKVIGDNELQVELAEGVRVRIIKQHHHRHHHPRRIGARRQGVRRGRQADAAGQGGRAGRAQEPAGQPVRRRQEVAPARSCSIFRAGRSSASSPSPRWPRCSRCPTCCRAACSTSCRPGITQSRINLGLDLRGGAHFLLEADLRSVLNERLTNLSDSVRGELRKQQIGFKDVTVQSGDAVDRGAARREPARQGDRGAPHGRSLAAVVAASGDTIQLAYLQPGPGSQARRK